MVKIYPKVSDTICKSTFCGKSYVRNKTALGWGQHEYPRWYVQYSRVFMNVFWNCAISRSSKLIAVYTGCPRRKGPNFGRVFLRSNYTDITQNTYIQSSMVTEISAREV